MITFILISTIWLVWISEISLQGKSQKIIMKIISETLTEVLTTISFPKAYCFRLFYYSQFVSFCQLIRHICLLFLFIFSIYPLCFKKIPGDICFFHQVFYLNHPYNPFPSFLFQVLHSPAKHLNLLTPPVCFSHYTSSSPQSFWTWKPPDSWH